MNPTPLVHRPRFCPTGFGDALRTHCNEWLTARA